MRARAVESQFLRRPFQPGTPLWNRILVLGGDDTGLELANRLAAEGFQAIVLGCHGNTQPGEGVVALEDSVLEAVQGFAGSFELSLRGPSGRVKERVGFIVAAAPGDRTPEFAAYGLTRSPRVMGLSDLEALLCSGNALEPRRGAWFHAAFLCGLASETEPAHLDRVLHAIDRLEDMGNLQPYVFTRNVKVAASGLERRYRRAREHGTVFFKFDAEPPRFEASAEGPLMVFTEPLLRVEMELLPDLIVVDDQTLPADALQPILDAIPSAAAYAPYLQPDSIRFSGVETAKKGILAVGASRGVSDPEIIRGDVDAVVTWLRQFTQGSVVPPLEGPAEVDPGKCTLCLTCVRLCPHGAITFYKAAEVDANSCARCGICAVECPNRAITLSSGSGSMDTPGQMRALLACCPDNKAKIAAFLCSRSAAQAFDGMPAAMRRRIVPVVVPCAGSVDPGHLLEALEAGADGLLVAGCFSGNCASIYGTVLADERTRQVGEALRDMGLNRDVLKFVQVAGNSAPALARGIMELAARLRPAVNPVPGT